MKKVLLCVIAVLTAAGCSRPEAEDATPTPKAATPVATPKPGDWMRNNGKVTPKAANPLSISDDPFAQKPKK